MGNTRRTFLDKQRLSRPMKVNRNTPYWVRRKTGVNIKYNKGTRNWRRSTIKK